MDTLKTDSLHTILRDLDYLIVGSLLVNHGGLYPRICVDVLAGAHTPSLLVEYNWHCMDAYGLTNRRLNIGEFNRVIANEGWISSGISIGLSDHTAELVYVSNIGLRLVIRFREVVIISGAAYTQMAQEPATAGCPRLPRAIGTGHFMLNNLQPSDTLLQNIVRVRNTRTAVDTQEQRDITL